MDCDARRILDHLWTASGVALLAALLLAPMAARAASLELAQLIPSPSGNVDDDLYGIAVSPDGKHVYIGDHGISAIVVMSRDPSTGVLTLVGTVPFFDPDFVEFLNVIVSPDGKFVYASDWEGSWTVATYSRDAATGMLTHLPPDVHGFNDPWDLAFSPDGALLYVAGSVAGMSIFSRNPTTGALTLLHQYDLENLSGGVATLSPGSVVVSPDGAQVYVESYSQGELVTFGTLPGGALDFLDIFGDGFGDSGPLFDAHGLAVGSAGAAISPDGQNVYVNAAPQFSLPAGVGAFARNASTGQLTLIDFTPISSHGHDFKDSIAVHPNGRWVDASLAGLRFFRRDVTTGMLTLADEHHDLGSGQIAVSPDGRHVYVSETDRTRVAAYRFRGCPPVPATGCRHQTLPGKGSLVIQDSPDDKKDVAVWKWASGAATTLADFDDPRTSADYAFCLYDQSGPGSTPHLLVQSTVLAGGTCRGVPCWRLTHNVKKNIDLGYDYSDSLRTIDGFNKISLRQGVAGLAKLSVKVGGAQIGSPAPPLTGTVTAQLQSVNGGPCWEATYSTPTLNGGGRYRAKGD